MKRSSAFHSAIEPLKDDSSLQLKYSHVAGPVPFLNPTKAHFRSDARRDVRFKWTSRNNRKGRHTLVVPATPSTTTATPSPTSSPRTIARGLWRMLTYYPVWDISFDVAYVFTIGSVIWVINAFFVWLPAVRPKTEFKNEELYGGGITAFIGATVFEFGSLLLMAEAVNENRTGCFGWAVERAADDIEQDKRHGGNDGDSDTILRPSKSHCTHHHTNKKNLVGKCGTITKQDNLTNARSWIWFPSTHDLKTHYLHSLGFLASFSQLLGASIFWISGLTALPGIYNHLTPSRPLIVMFYWLPQILGGLGFIISGTLFMLETQSKWYLPAPKTLGWWIGLWNLIGGMGFTVCPCFGLDESSWAQYQAGLSTFWGSWAFLMGSGVQWYESLEKFPVEAEGKEGGDGKV